MTEVYVGVGSNMDRAVNVASGVRALAQRFGALRLSTVFETAAVGFDGPDFYNFVVGFRTELEPEALAEALREIEYQHGRPRGPLPRNSSRTLDIDLLLYGELIRHDAVIDVPRVDLVKYAFVAGPMAELAPDLRHPESGETMAEIGGRFAAVGLRVVPLRLDVSSASIPA